MKEKQKLDFVFDNENKRLSPKIIRFVNSIGSTFFSYLAEDWLDNLSYISNSDEINPFVKENKGKGGGDQRAIFHNISEKIIQHLSNIKRDEFTLLTSAITLDVYSRFLNNTAWTEKIKDCIPNNIEYINDPIALMVSLFESFYDSGNKNNQNISNTTDSLAFWYIARAVFTYNNPIRKDLIQGLNKKSDGLKSYFLLLGEKVNAEDLDESDNLFLDYLIKRKENKDSPLSSVGEYKINDARKSIFYYQRQATNSLGEADDKTISVPSLIKSPQNIVVLGESRSGKTTIVKQLKHASDFSNDVEPNFTLDKFHDPENKITIDYWSIEKNLPDETIEKTIALQGNFQSFGSDVSIYLHDHNGALFKDDDPRRVSTKREEKNELEQLCEECDQLIVTIPPYLIDSNKKIDNILTRLFQYARLAMLSNKDVVISIAYTMCDDYGCIIDGPRRVIHDAKGAELFHIFKYADGQEKNVAWDKFIDYSTASEEPNPQWSSVKRHLLQKTKELWRKIAHKTGENHYNVNGYFVSAMHPGQENDIENFNKRGVLEIISDYLQFMSPPRNFNINVSKSSTVDNSKSYFPSKDVEVNWQFNGPHMKEYRVYGASDRNMLLQRGEGADIISIDQLAHSNFWNMYSTPLGIIPVEYNLETNLPVLSESGFYTFIERNVQRDKDLYYQVLAVDKFNYFSFSNIQDIQVDSEGGFVGFIMSWDKNIRIASAIAFFVTVFLIITLKAKCG